MDASYSGMNSYRTTNSNTQVQVSLWNLCHVVYSQQLMVHVDCHKVTFIQVYDLIALCRFGVHESI